MILPAGFFPPDEEPGSEELDCNFDPAEFDAPDDAVKEELPPIRPLCEEFFAPGGPLRQAAARGGRPYEFRPQQIEMSGAIADAIAAGSNLCVEAPTGVGKSFAYLVPLIYRSRSSGRPAIISTETINLQEQLMEKDIPLLRELTGINFRAALAKGRHNYLCRRRLSLLSGEERDALLPAPSLALDLDRIVKWLEHGADGDRDSITFRMDSSTWNLVCCEAGNCLGKKCSFFRNCCYFKARQEWECADIVVANHALFFTDLAMRCAGGNAGALLPNYGAVLIDEAHTLENNAAEHLGLHLSRAGVIGTLNRLYNPDSARGLLMRQGYPPELRGAVVEARDEACGFFTPYENFLAERGESAREVTDPARFPDHLSGKLIQLCRALETEIDNEEDASFRAELESQFSRCREFIDAIDSFTSRSIPESVYYVESDRRSVVLHAAPLNVAEILGEVLFNQDFPVMLCSATLSVRRSFDYFRKRTGFRNGETLLLDSPFGPDQAKIYIPRSMPDPSSENFNAALAAEIPRFIEVTHGKAFVLFTSYQSLRYCTDALRGYFLESGIRLLVQGESQTRSGLLKEFREDIDSVLFGTDSFWTGVDVPGEALSNVIVTKLPFASPGHPLIRARMARIEAEGRSSFTEYSLPEAVLKFRQGVGRLIRSRSDHGIIVLLDRRVLTKNYGRLFLDSLPYKFEQV